MKLRELLKGLSDVDILQRMHELFPQSSLDGCQHVLTVLRGSTQSPLEVISGIPDMELLVITYEDDSFLFDDEVEPPETDKYYTTVVGYSRQKSSRYGLFLTPWREWLDYDINMVSYEERGGLNFFAYVLQEMTYMGYVENNVVLETEKLRKSVSALGKTQGSLRSIAKKIDTSEDKEDYVSPTTSKSFLEIHMRNNLELERLLGKVG